MRTQTTTVKGTANALLHVRITKPVNTPKAILHILHGMAEHAQRYDTFAQYLAEAGIVVVAHDHRSHGHSVDNSNAVGILKPEDTFEAIIDDVKCVVDAVKSQYETLPCMMLGHSMGSVILRRYLAIYPNTVSKAIVMGSPPRYPFLFVKLMRFVASFSGVFIPSTKRRKAFAAMLNRGFLKHYKSIRTPFDWLSTDTKVVDAYIDDPLCGYPYNNRFYRRFFKLVDQTNQVRSIQKTPSIPIVFISGTKDPLADNMKAVKRLENHYQNKTRAHTTCIGIEGARHEVLNEKDTLPAYRAVLNFLEVKK